MKPPSLLAWALVVVGGSTSCGPELGDTGGAGGRTSGAQASGTADSEGITQTGPQGDDAGATTADTADGTADTTAGIDPMLEPLGPDAVVDVCTSRQHTCAASADGRVKCWGTSERGALGSGSLDVLGDDELPIDIPEIPIPIDVVDVECGSIAVTCARSDAGAVACWGAAPSLGLERGSTSEGDLGDDEVPGAEAIVPLDGDAMLLSVAQAKACVALANGGVRCWGSNNLGLGGDWPDLGDNLGDDEPVTSVPALDVGGTPTGLITDLVSACAASDAGLSCWALGPPEVVYQPRPADGVIVDVAQRPVGVGHGEPCMVLSTGAVACGLPDSIDIVEHDLGGPVEEVWSGVCFRVSGIGIRCYGHNEAGRLGLGHTMSVDLEPADTAESNVLPFGDLVVDMSMGLSHTCAILEGGWLLCYGLGEYGALGYGSTDPYGESSPPQVEAAYRVFD